MQLIDICELIVDCEHRTAPTQEAGYPSIRTPNIGRGYFILDGVNRVSEETYRLWTRRAVPQVGDLVMAREAPVGNVAIVREGLRPCLGQRTLLIRPDHTKVDALFLNYFMNGPQVQAIVQSKTNGVTVPHLNMGDVRIMELPKLPPLPVQQKIAAVLSAYDDLIENNTRRIKLLEQMAQALYREWFVCPCQAGNIPEGWEAKKLGEVTDINAATIRRGQEPAEIDYIDISSVTPGCIEQVDHWVFADAPGRARRIVKHGDIIWSCVRPNRRSYALILKPQLNLIVSTGFAVITGKNAPYTYLYHVLTAEEFVGYLTNHARGAAYPAVTGEDFENAKIALPPATLLDRFHAITAPQFDLIHNLHLKNVNLRRTRDLLLPKLISGELPLNV